MSCVFIGGSRKVSRLTPNIRQRLDRIIERKLQVFVGDANGADKAVQQYFKERNYPTVLVFCMAAHCRNNVGGWQVEEISAPKGVRGAEFYTVKDRAMTDRSSCGFMLWDGKSTGTLANVIRLIDQQKPVVVYRADSHEFTTLKNREDLNKFLERQEQPSAQPDTERVLFR